MSYIYNPIPNVRNAFRFIIFEIPSKPNAVKTPLAYVQNVYPAISYNKDITFFINFQKNLFLDYSEPSR